MRPPNRSRNSVALLSGAILTCALLVSCGGGGGSTPTAGSPATPNTPTAATTRTGTLVAFAIRGLSYSTLDANGTTGTGVTATDGSWTYRCTSTCGTVTFSIGGITLGQTNNAANIALRELPGGVELGVLSDATLRKGQFLVALDADADPSNGITLSTELATALTGKRLDFGASTFDADLAALVTGLRSNTALSASYRAGILIPSREVVRALLEQAESMARGVFVDAPTADGSVASEVRKYVLSVPDASMSAYTGSSDLLRTTYVRGLQPALGGGLAVVPNTGPTVFEIKTVSSRGITVPAPKYFDGVTASPASVIVTNDANASPSVGTFQLSSGAADLKSLTPIKTVNDVLFSGRPVPLGASGSDGARNLYESLRPRDPEFDQQGLDPAGITIAADGTTWICDRRGPFLMQLDAQGRAIVRIGPQGVAGSLPGVNRLLPAILEARQAGLGCGGLAMRPTSGDVLLAVGAPLDIAGRTAKNAKLVRLVSFAPRTNIVRQYAVPVQDFEFGYQILDLETLSENRVLALVRYRDGSATGAIVWDVRIFDLSNATAIDAKTLTNGPNSSLALEYGTASEIGLSGVTLATSTRLVELRPLGWTLEGAEGLAKLDAQTLLVMGQVNGGVTSRIVNGDPNLKVEDHQVDTNGLITPRGAGSTAAPTFAIVPDSPERRQIVLWSIKLKTLLQ